jgi:hypothetical protein
MSEGWNLNHCTWFYHLVRWSTLELWLVSRSLWNSIIVHLLRQTPFPCPVTLSLLFKVLCFSHQLSSCPVVTGNAWINLESNLHHFTVKFTQVDHRTIELLNHFFPASGAWKSTISGAKYCVLYINSSCSLGWRNQYMRFSGRRNSLHRIRKCDDVINLQPIVDEHWG